MQNIWFLLEVIGIARNQRKANACNKHESEASCIISNWRDIRLVVDVTSHVRLEILYNWLQIFQLEDCSQSHSQPTQMLCSLCSAHTVYIITTHVQQGIKKVFVSSCLFVQKLMLRFQINPCTHRKFDTRSSFKT